MLWHVSLATVFFLFSVLKKKRERLFAIGFIKTNDKIISFGRKELNIFLFEMMKSISSFEILPDEILLNVCRYLSTGHVLYALYNLNSRLNVTITGYCRHINLSRLTYPEFNHVGSYIIPQIAPFVQSIVFRCYRDTIWRTKTSVCFDPTRISSLFPQLQKIRFERYNGDTLSSFIDNLENLSELRELNIMHLNEPAKATLLTNIFSANNHQLNSIVFNSYSASFDLSKINQSLTYTNIQKLQININSLDMLPQLFAMIPAIEYLHVISKEILYSLNSEQKFVHLFPLIKLTYFHLLSNNELNLNELHGMLQQMPSLETLVLNIATKDECFIKRDDFLACLPLSLKQIHFLIRYHFSEITFDLNDLIASWSASFSVNCLIEENNKRLFIFTQLPAVDSFRLPATVGKQIVPQYKFKQYIGDLFIFNGTSSIDILSTIQHFERVKVLEINGRRVKESCQDVNQSIVLNLSQLEKLNVVGKCSIFDIIRAAPHFDELAIDFDWLQVSSQHEPTWNILRKKIDRLEMHFDKKLELHMLQDILHDFDCLKHLCIIFNSPPKEIESILSIILAESNVKQLISIMINVSKTITTDIDRQWIVDHSYLTMDDEFAVTITSGFFVLWK